MNPNDMDLQGLERDLEELERTDPAVAKAAERLDDTIWRIGTGIERRTFTPSATAEAPQRREDLVARALLLDQVAAAAREESQQLRARLQEQAHSEFAAGGGAPTWRLPDLATVTLPVSQTRVVVTDEAALTKYVAARYPHNVEPRIRPAFMKPLLEQLVTRDGDRVIDDEGTAVPGLAVQHGGQPGSISVRPNADAKKRAAYEARVMLAAVLAAAEEPHSEDPEEVTSGE